MWGRIVMGRVNANQVPRLIGAVGAAKYGGVGTCEPAVSVLTESEIVAVARPARVGLLRARDREVARREPAQIRIRRRGARSAVLRRGSRRAPLHRLRRV